MWGKNTQALGLVSKTDSARYPAAKWRGERLVDVVVPGAALVFRGLQRLHRDREQSQSASEGKRVRSCTLQTHRPRRLAAGAQTVNKADGKCQIN